MPTPGYWTAVLHSRLMGTSVLRVSADGTDDTVFSAYGHCSKGVQGSYSLLLVNFAKETTTVTLPIHGNRTEYVRADCR